VHFRCASIAFVLAVPLGGSIPAGASVAPAVTIVAPVAGSNVTGTTTVQPSVSSSVTRTEFYVDGVLQGTDTTAPFSFAWNTAANPLPAPNHPIDFGYFLVDGRYGDHRSEVNSYTNLYHAWARRGYEANSGTPDDEWLRELQKALKNAAAEGRRIYLNLNLQEQAPGRITPVDRVLDVAAPYWSHIVRVELADEPEWDRAQTEAQIDALHARIRAHGLPPRPMGVIYTRDQTLTTDAIFAANLDFVIIEAYVEAPGSADPQVNIDFLGNTITAAKNRVPADKQIGLVMQAYARNGGWTNIDTLRDLQAPTYLLAHDDPRVVMISMFSYGRPSGTRQHQELRTPHRLIGERILGRRVVAAGHGPRTLVVKAFDAAGNSASSRITVRVQSNRPGDFVGDAKADVTVYQPSTGRWAILNPEIGPPLSYPWGLPGDIPLAGDHLGSGKVASTVFRPSTGAWWIFSPATGETQVFAWGIAGDIPLSGDFVGDGRADLVVYRPSEGVWYIRDPNTGETVVRQWGIAGDMPVVGDFLGDGRAELTVFRGGSWYITNPATGETAVHQFGVPGDIPITGDFLGNGRTELTVYRPSDGSWHIRDAGTGETAIHSWGVPGDRPVAADYLGDGRTDLTVFRPSTGTWFIRDPNNGNTVTIPWGGALDVPIA